MYVVYNNVVVKESHIGNTYAVIINKYNKYKKKIKQVEEFSPLHTSQW